MNPLQLRVSAQDQYKIGPLNIHGGGVMRSTPPERTVVRAGISSSSLIV